MLRLSIGIRVGWAGAALGSAGVIQAGSSALELNTADRLPDQSDRHLHLGLHIHGAKQRVSLSRFSFWSQGGHFTIRARTHWSVKTRIVTEFPEKYTANI